MSLACFRHNYERELKRSSTRHTYTNSYLHIRTYDMVTKLSMQQMSPLPTRRRQPPCYPHGVLRAQWNEVFGPELEVQPPRLWRWWIGELGDTYFVCNSCLLASVAHSLAASHVLHIELLNLLSNILHELVRAYFFCYCIYFHVVMYVCVTAGTSSEVAYMYILVRTRLCSK